MGKLTLFSEKKKSVPKVRHIEVWGHLVEMNRNLRNMLILSAIISLIAVSTSSGAVFFALKRPLIYYVGEGGQAVYGGRLENASRPQEVEVASVSKRFLQGMIALNSLTVERDFATSFNLMTAELQGQQDKYLESWKAEEGKSFVEFVRAAGIRTTLEFSALDITNHGGQQFSVTAKGAQHTWPLEGDALAEPKTKNFESQLTLVTVPRTEDIPNGLLVSHQVIKYFEPKNAAQDLEETKGLERAPKQ